MVEYIQTFAEGVHPVLQVLIVMAAGAVPFIESYLGSVVGVVAGMPVPVAIVAAVVGNLISTGILIVLAAKARESLVRKETASSPKRLRLKRLMDRFGVPGVSLLGPTVVASQITGPALIGFGASRTQVMIWQAVAIVVWGIAFGVLASLGVAFLG